jgi:8-oxo-dGTP pyrophosphatase MutT (NUDIX family)
MQLSELTAAPNTELSTGLILSWHDKLVFELDPRAAPLSTSGRSPGSPTSKVLAIVGVGGHLEPGEGWCEAVMREATEEASCQVALADSPQTYLCRQAQTPQPISCDWREPFRPLLIWQATFSLPRGPQKQMTPVNFVNAVFPASALAAPRPAAEVKALLLLDETMLLSTYAAPRSLAELLARGAQLIGQTPPPETLLAPGGTAYFYAQWLVSRRG